MNKKEVMKVSAYRDLIKKWSEELITTVENFLNSFRDQSDSELLNEWRENVFQFQRDIPNLEENEVYERANELHQQLEECLGVKREEDFRNDRRSVPIGGHKLPPLPYSYDALEPHINREIMKLHHQKHHQSYVDGLNKAEKEMQKARSTHKFDLIKHWEREAAFNGAGHYLHTIFWNNMRPNGVGQPSGELLQTINQSFGNFNQFKNHFSEAANAVEGGGWAILVWSPRSGRLEILQAEKHQNLSQWDVVPLLALDVWEHAYYLQYKNERKKYIENWWNVVNWRDVENRFNQASKLTWQPF
jgi:superoxide dismutase, Fe-Mn family